ncbi:MAG: tetratricopeptide repeat protein [Calditrichota bacterium]
MKKIAISVIATLVVAIVFSACRPPEIEGVVIDMRNNANEAAIDKAKLATDKYPDNPEAWFYYGYLNGEHKKDYTEMNRAFDKALELNPAQVVTMPDGGTLTAQNAIDNYRGTLFAESFNGGIKKLNAAQAAEGEERTKLLADAQMKMETAKDATPDRSETYHPLALVYLMQGDTSKVEGVLGMGMEKASDDEEFLTKAGSMLLQIGKPEQAEPMFKKAMEMNPDNGVNYQMLGNLEANRKNWEKANEYYEQAIKLNPSDGDLAYNIGVGYYSQQKWAEAIPYFTQALEAGLDEEQTYKILGVCYVQADKNDEGMAFLENAVTVYPANASLWEYLAIVYGKKQMGKKADEAYKKSQELSKTE